MLQDNYAEYDRNKSRGIPRPGKALLHGIIYCGECGHKMVVQYKGRTQYLCTYLRGQYGVPVCQHIPADPVDDAVVEAFFRAYFCEGVDFSKRAEVIEVAVEAGLERNGLKRMFASEDGLAEIASRLLARCQSRPTPGCVSRKTS